MPLSFVLSLNHMSLFFQRQGMSIKNVAVPSCAPSWLLDLVTTLLIDLTALVEGEGKVGLPAPKELNLEMH